MTVPYTFGSATAAIPLSQLDANFATTITLGNTAIQLGNTVTTLNNMTLVNATVSSGNVTIGQANAVVYTNSSNVATSNSSALAFDGTNIGVGVVPVGLDSRFKNIEIGSSTSLSDVVVSSTNLLTYLQHNSYVDASGVTKYKASGSNYASQYNQSGTGAHNFQSTATANTGGNACTFTTVLSQGGVGKTLALEGASAQTGTGITFPATQSASSDANTLDDYEEGTFSPAIAGTSAAGTPTYASDGQIGRYTKIGNRCYFNIWLNWTNISGATGTLRASNLPFNTKSVTGAYSCVTVYMDASVTLGAGGVVQGYLPTNDNYVYLSYYTSGGSNANGISIDTVGALMISGHYETA